MQQLPLPGICPADKLCRPARRSLALNENDTPVRQHNGRNGTLVKFSNGIWWAIRADGTSMSRAPCRRRVRK
jgi:hypothetical protein